MKRAIASVAAAIAFAAVSAAAQPACTNCNDTGSIRLKCPVCRGTKYMWKCIDTAFQSGKYESFTDDGVFCGYGATYTPLHPNCRRTRTRVVCPQCVSKSKSSATGVAVMPCPDCDGRGGLYMDVVAIVDEERLTVYQMNNAFPRIEAGERAAGGIFFQHRFTPGELADFTTVFPYARIFHDAASARLYAEEVLQRKAAVGEADTATLRSHHPSQRVVVRAHGVPPAEPAPPAPRAYTKEEVEDMAAAEDAHDREMFRRRHPGVEPGR